MSGGRFVVQEHTTPEGIHWDLMLEQDGSLITFRLEDPPAYWLTRSGEACPPRTAIRIFDHPMRFLTYEGPVQKGTGKVRIADRGQYELRQQNDRLLNFHLHGALLRGSFTLTRTEGDQWRLAAQDTPECGPSRNSNRP